MSSDMKKNFNIVGNFARLQQYIANDAPRIMGIEAVNHFKESFEKGGFTDRSFVPWHIAKRLDSSSPWFGFQYRARVATPDNHPKRKGAKRAYKARKVNPITNFSPAATKRKTLTGLTGDLADSLHYLTRNGKAIVRSNLAYANIQNKGGYIKIFGKKSVYLRPRKFVGYSYQLQNRIHNILKQDIDKILRS